METDDTYTQDVDTTQQDFDSGDQSQEFVDGGDSGNDASNLYAPYLEKFPTSLHSIATDVFKTWDADVTKRFQNLHSTYQPYQEFVDTYEPDAIRQAVQLAETFDQNPQAIYEYLHSQFGGAAESEQGVEDQEFEEPAGDEYEDPRLAQHEQLLTALAETIIGEREAKAQAEQQQQQDQWFAQTMDSLRETYGTFDETYVTALIAQGWDPEQAVQQFSSTVDQYMKQQNAASASSPTVMRSGGGVPSIQKDPTTLSSQDTKALIVQMLQAQKEQ